VTRESSMPKHYALALSILVLLRCRATLIINRLVIVWLDRIHPGGCRMGTGAIFRLRADGPPLPSGQRRRKQKVRPDEERTSRPPARPRGAADNRAARRGRRAPPVTRPPPPGRPGRASRPHWSVAGAVTIALANNYNTVIGK
jgi:hypothetical protein